jgi:hypothetical protein
MEMKIYVAGKVSPNSVFGTSDWRDQFCQKLSEKSGCKIINLDPTKTRGDLGLMDEKDSKLIVGRDCFMIKSADLVIVNLTDDISVGGSQEMLIAKYYNKPLVGIAPLGGKFRKKEKEMYGKVYQDYSDPFVTTTCDLVVEDLDELSGKLPSLINGQAKEIDILDKAVEYYKDSHYPADSYLKSLGL